MDNLAPSDRVSELQAAELRQNLLADKASRPGNEAFKVSFLRRCLTALGMVAAGMAAAMVFHPLDWGWLAWIMLLPLFWVAWSCPRRQPAWRMGLCWGWGFTFCSFFWLREIEWFIPPMLALVIGLFPACWAAAVPWLRWGLLYSAETRLKGYDALRSAPRRPADWLRELLLLSALAGWWCVLEWIRSWIGTGFPWNYLAATQWRNVVVLQICEYTGLYGVSFLVVAVNLALGLTVINAVTGIRRGRMIRPLALIAVLALTALTLCAGFWLGRRAAVQFDRSPKINFRVAVLQGDISQRRHASDAEAKEALEKYLALSRQALALKPDLIVWPETAVPYPYRASDPFCYWYRFSVTEMIRQSQVPFLIGSIDFEEAKAGSSEPPGVLNSALFIDRTRNIVGKFDKVHIVPFGEFVPFRRHLPKWVVDMIDMGRDLSRGKHFNPIEVYPGAYAGIGICFEDVFPYVSRAEALAGANLLLVITNDAWYPTSAEPEQHLVGSIFRTVETRLPMVRCGNNSASCLIRPDGVVVNSIFRERDADGNPVCDWSRRGSGVGLFPVSLIKQPPLTFYTRFGDLFILFCGMIFGAAMLTALWQWRQRCLRLRETFD